MLVADPARAVWAELRDPCKPKCLETPFPAEHPCVRYGHLPTGRGGCAGIPKTSTRAHDGQTELNLKKKRKESKIRCVHRHRSRSDPSAFPSQAGYLVISRISLVHHPSEGDASERVSPSMTSSSGSNGKCDSRCARSGAKGRRSASLGLPVRATRVL